jgi:hypothetical protein
MVFLRYFLCARGRLVELDFLGITISVVDTAGFALDR